MRTKTFHGPTHRVQVMVLDLTPDDIKFAVYTLPNHYHPSTAFRCYAGSQHYYGGDIGAAWRTVQQFCPGAKWPRSWRRFLTF